MFEVFLGFEEFFDLEFVLFDVEVKVKYFLVEDFSQEVMEFLLEGELFFQEVELQLMFLELLLGLYDSFVEVEVKLVRFFFTVVRTDVFQADVFKVFMQVVDVMQDVM